jgi:hypothetical protein
VDAINYSIGSPSPSDLWNDFDTVGFLAAREAGIFVATSAGNDGPGFATVGSPTMRTRRDVPRTVSLEISVAAGKVVPSIDSSEAVTSRAALSRTTSSAAAEPSPDVSSSSWAAYGCIDAGRGELVVIDDRGEPTFTFDDPATIDAVASGAG